MTALAIRPGRSLVMPAYAVLSARLKTVGWKRARLSEHCSALVQTDRSLCRIMWVDSPRWPFRAPIRLTDPVMVHVCVSNTLQVISRKFYDTLADVLREDEEALPA